MGGGTVSKRFLLDEQKSTHPCDVSWRTEASCRSKRDVLYICVRVGTSVHVSVCHKWTKGMHQFIFCWQELPRKQRRYSSTFRSGGAQIECVTYSREGDRRRQRRGEINAKAKKLGSQMVMVETSIHSEFPATVPCLSPLDYFLVQGLPHFKASSLPTSVIWSC